MRNVIISCQDATTCIKQWDTEETLFYVDPPYPDTQQCHYSGYTTEMFNELAQTLETIKGKYLLSCYAKPGMHVPANARRIDFKATMSAKKPVPGEKRQDNERTETVYTNSHDLTSALEIAS
jgi:site-specific DNA-adenine methylase